MELLIPTMQNQFSKNAAETVNNLYRKCRGDKPIYSLIMSENTYFRNHFYKCGSLVKTAVLILIQNFTSYISEYL
jgi:hypothetical protein